MSLKILIKRSVFSSVVNANTLTGKKSDTVKYFGEMESNYVLNYPNNDYCIKMTNRIFRLP